MVFWKNHVLLPKAYKEGVALGDLFPDDVRQYRERMMARTGITPLSPYGATHSQTEFVHYVGIIWYRSSRALTRKCWLSHIVDSGFGWLITMEN